jgi:acetyltransferase-like isoleucine patch superfamily enzyme
MAQKSLMRQVRALILRYRLWSLRRSGLQIGDDCSMGSLGGFPAFGSEPYLISIGNRVGFGPRVMFVTHDGGTAVINREPPYQKVTKYGRITVHDNTFLGANVLLMPGAEVGPNSIVGAGAVVTRVTPPDSVIAGAPARAVMSIEEYARQCLASAPDFDPTAYRQDKRSEIIKIFPRPW